MKSRDIFGLAVRLLGLYFLYLGLYSLSQNLNVDVFQNPSWSDIITSFLPALFDLLMALGLIRGGFLVRFAYPEKLKSPDGLPRQEGQAKSSPQIVPAPELTAMEGAEKKLAALVEKPKDIKAA